jgi:hypothetical protein
LGDGISRDPIAEKGGVNLYCFVANTPVDFIDGDGRVVQIPNPFPFPLPPILIPIDPVPPPILDPDDQVPSDYTGFAICQRDVVEGGCVEELVNKCGQGHKYLARFERGEITTGKGYYSSGVETEETLICERGNTCERTNTTLKYGQYRGMNAELAGDRAIWDCINSHPGWKRNYYKPPIRDCRHFASKAATDCGLDCGQ